MPGYNTTGGHTGIARLNDARIYDAIRKGVNVAAFAAFVSAQNRAPVRRIFYGHRARAPRLLTLQEAQLELPELRRAMGGIAGPIPRHGVRTNNDHRPKHNSWIATGTPILGEVVARREVTPVNASTVTRQVATGETRQVMDSRGNINTVKIFKEIEEEEPEMRTGPTPGGYRLANPANTGMLSAQGLYELKSGRAVIHNILGGGLRKSITFHAAVIGAKEIKASVSAGNAQVKYARYVEFGTRHAAAQPFMRPALKVAAARLRTDVVTALRNR